MMMGFRMRIYPNEEQEKLLFEWCRHAHNAWNFLVEKYIDKFPKISKYGIFDYKESNLINDLNMSVPKRIIRDVIQKYVFAIKKFYKHDCGKPKFHKYNPKKQSICFSTTCWNIHDYKIYFPTIGLYNRTKKNMLKLDKNYIDKYNITYINNPRIIYDNNIWYLSGCYEVKDVEKSQNKEMLGLDWGLKNFMTTSDGKFINYPKSVLREYQRIMRLQSVMDRKVKYSNNYYKALSKLQSAYKRFRELKRNFIEQKTTELAKVYNISVEKIDTKFVLSSKNFRRYLMIAPKSRFLDTLKWKCEKYGSYYIEVNPAYTSQTCSKCGQLHKLKLSDRMMVCDCGNVLDRDINAAINIANEGRKILSSMGVCCTC